MSDPTTEAPPAEPRKAAYQDDDLVYVDPQAKIVVGKVEFDAAGRPKPKPLPTATSETSETHEEDVQQTHDAPKKGRGRGRPRTPRIRYCPWGTYRSMKHVFKLEGKPPRVESDKTLDEVMEKALREPFWN